MSTTTQPKAHDLDVPSATMRTLVGVDRDDLHLPALELLGRLRFAGNRVTLAHVEPPVGPQLASAPLVYDYRDAGELEAIQRQTGRAILGQAEERARGLGLGEGLDTVFATGATSTTLLRLAEEHRSDLVAVGSGGRGALGSFFLGSVGRALAIGADRSFLVGRGDGGREGPVRAVFATDHSDYAARCFRRLLDMDPRGLSELTVVTATDPAYERRLLEDVGVEDGPYALSRAESRLREAGEHMVRRWRERGGAATFRLMEGHPAEALGRAMEETGADLLILGARGHGFIDRVFIGSLALHMVVAEPFSVLVLRLPVDA